ncbi:MAG TPA: aspartate kinase [Oligoflexia bacterium]|nr:aspartate kinase [Oligoflexia bacterium]HMP49273.1 aspartate kinase [Oligoflexia bacterium]
MKPVLVKKFGGTSVGSPARLRSLVQIVKSARENYDPVVVVSAVSASEKNRGTTSLLLQAARKAALGDSSFKNELEEIYLQHDNLINEVITEPRASSIKAQIRGELDRVQGFLNALMVIREVSPGSLDVVVSSGERMSAMLVAEALLEASCEAFPSDLSLVLADASEIDYSSQDIGSDSSWYDSLSSIFSTYIFQKSAQDKIPGSVPVVTGFFGPVPGGLLNRVGRGYSDLTGALIARGLGRERVAELQVWKEVDGVFSADPRRVPGARVLTEISPVEAVELTFFGSEVLHPYTMEQVTSVGIPIRVLNSLKPHGAGTIIKPFSANDSGSGGRESGHVTAVTAKRGIVVLSITSNRMYDAQGFLANLFGILNEFNLVVDLVSTSEVTVSCTVNDISKLRKATSKLEALGEMSILEDRAILAVVGEGLRYNIKPVSKMCEALSLSGISVEMITQAATRNSISCVVPEDQVESGLKIVHEALFG